MNWKRYAFAFFGTGVFIICAAGARSDQGGACVTCREYLGGDLARPVLELFPVLILVYYRLSQREESEMIALYGDAYRRYMEKSPMFVPGLKKRR